MKSLSQTKQFLRDVKRMRKRGVDVDSLKNVVTSLLKDQQLDPKHRDHALTGNWQAFRDCHIGPDWILIYSSTKDRLRLERTGTHNDLFKK